MSEGSGRMRLGGRRPRSNNSTTKARHNHVNDTNKNNNGVDHNDDVDGNNNNNCRKVATGPARSTTSSPPVGGLVGLCVTPGPVPGRVVSGRQGNTENMVPAVRYQARSAGPVAKRQMARDCGLKSLPISDRRWTPSGRSNLLLDLVDQGASGVKQSQVFLQAPDGNVKPQRGLSGSKIQHTPGNSRPGTQTPRAASVGTVDSQHHHSSDINHHQLHHNHHYHYQNPHPYHYVTETVAYPVSPSPRPQSKRFNTRAANAPVPDEDEGTGIVRGYKWNSSDQGIRLQRQLSSLSSSRNMKRASEMVSHRLDPMYMMNGSKISLQNRYCVDDNEMKRLQEMNQIKEGLMSDLKKMKFPYGARASKHVVRTLKHHPPVGDTPRATDIHARGNQDSTQNPIHPSTPASQPNNGATNQEQERPPSEHTDTESSHAATD